MTTPTLQVLSSADMATTKVREFLMLAGKDGCGKSSALVSQAKLVEELQPDAHCWVIDTENKFPSAMRSYGPDAPRNVVLYKAPTMNHATAALAEILAKAQPWDWIFVESMSRVWERAQDLAYQAQAGVTKVEYLEKKKKSPVPGNVGDFWTIAKGAHDSAFFDLMTQLDNINIIVTTTVTKPRDGSSFMKESVDRKATRVELGIDVGLDGAPRLPYYVESLGLLDLKGGVVTCRMLRDNLSLHEITRVEFEVPTKRDFALQFYANCRA